MSVFRSLVVSTLVVCASASALAQLKVPKNAASAPPAKQEPAQPKAATSPAADAATAEKESAGTLAAAGWLTLLDRRDWGTAWEASSSVFRSSVPLPSWMDAIPKLRESFGALVERSTGESVYKTTLEGRPTGDYVSVVFASKFDKQEIEEVITTVREADGKWRVTGYSIR